MSKINVGVQIDVEKFMETRAAIIADSGSGKTWLIKKFNENLSGKVQQIIIDPEGDFSSLREKFPFALVAKTGGDIPLSIRYAEAIAHKLLEMGISAIIDLYELKQDERELFVKLFAEALINAPKSLRNDCIVWLDEGQMFCPEDKTGISWKAIVDLATRGRKRGLCIVPATQRASLLNKSLLAQCKNKFIGSTSLDIDQKRVASELGIVNKNEILALRDLDAGEFNCFGPAISKQVVKFKTLPLLTSHEKHGKKQYKAPPTPDAIKKILSKLDSLPEEAEKELDTKKKLQDEVRRLTIELKKKPAPVVATQDANLKREVASLKSQLQTEKNCYAALVKIAQNTNAQLSKGVAILTAIPGIEIPERKAIPIHESGSPVAKQLRSSGVLPINNGTMAVPKTSAANVYLSKSSANKDADNRPIPSGERAVLIACAQFGHAMERNQLTVLTGYKRSSRDAYIARLKEKGYLESSGTGIAATEAGIAALGDDYEPLPTGFDLQQYWLQRLPQGEKAMLQILIENHPNPSTREHLSEITGYLRSSRDAYLARMASKELVVMVGRGEVKASDNLFN